MLVGIISEDADCRGFLAANSAILAALGGKSTLLRLDSQVPAHLRLAPSGIPGNLTWCGSQGDAAVEIFTANRLDAAQGASQIVCCGSRRQMEQVFHVEHAPTKMALFCDGHEEFECAIRERFRSNQPALLPYPLLRSPAPFPVLTDPVARATRALLELYMEIFVHD